MREAPRSSGSTPPDAPASSSSGLLKEFVHKDELARQFGVSGRTIERWVRLRILPPPVRLGRTSLYHVPTIQKHLARQLDSINMAKEKMIAAQ